MSPDSSNDPRRQCCGGVRWSRPSAVEPPWPRWRLWRLGSGHGGLSQLTVVGGLQFCRGEVTDLAVQPAVVVPVDVGESGQLDLLEAAPGAMAADQLGLVQPDDRLGQAVVVAVADRADRRRGADLGEAFGVADRGVLPRFKGVVATLPCWPECSRSSRASAGVLQPRVLRGRLLRAVATAVRSPVLWLLRLVPLGKYWRSRPLDAPYL